MKNGSIHWVMCLINDRVRVLSGFQDSLVGCESFPCIGVYFFFKTPSRYNTQIWTKPFVTRC